MTSELSCERAGTLLAARASGLSEADALRLEQHLEGCSRCAADAEIFALLGETRAPRGGGRLAARALARAMAGERPRPLPARSPSRAPLAFSVATIVAAIALLGLASAGPTRPDAPTEATAAPTGRARADEPVRVTVGHGTIDLEAGSEIAWEDTRVTLLAGRVTCDVDPSAHRPFSVHTEGFDVLVLGTRFSVDADRVAVERGTVEVRQHGEPVATLHAGDAWEPARLADATGATPADERPEASRRRPSAATRFARAAALEPSDPDAACALYAEVERGGSAWASPALFARARLELSRGRREEGRALLERYVAAHPDGVNAADARMLLERE